MMMLSKSKRLFIGWILSAALAVFSLAAWAEIDTSQSAVLQQISIDDLDNSHAVRIYRALFGSLVDYAVLDIAPNNEVDSALAGMALIFNLSVFVVLTWMLMVVTGEKVLVGGNDGTLLSKRYNDTMAVSRGVLSICGLIPMVKGFCLAQVFVIFIAVQASFLGDAVNREAAKITYTTGAVIPIGPDFMMVDRLLQNMLISEVCATATNYYFAQHPRFKTDYEITIKNTTAQVPVAEGVNHFQYSYVDPHGKPMCGTVGLEVGDDELSIGDFEDDKTSDPLGGTFVDGLTRHKTLLRDKMVDAHHVAVLNTHERFVKGIQGGGAGLLRADKPFNSNLLKAAMIQARVHYIQDVHTALRAVGNELDAEWEKEMDAKLQSNALTLAGKKGWLYNGFTWIDKSRLDGFMGRLSRAVPTTTEPMKDDMDVMLQSDIVKRTFNLIAEIDKQRLSEQAEGIQKKNKQEQATSSAELDMHQYHKLMNQMAFSGEPEKMLASAMSMLFNHAVWSQFNFRDYDPLINMQQFGHRLVTTGFTIKAFAKFLQYGVEGGKEAANNSWAMKVADVFSAGAASGIKGFALAAVKDFALMLSETSDMMITIGSILAYWLPLLPVFMWTLAVMGHYALVILLFLAAPLWWAAHAMPEGAGFAGDHARQGWIMTLSVLSRPAIMVFGWHLSLTLMREIGYFASNILHYIPLANGDAIVGPWGALFSLAGFLLIEMVIIFRCLAMVHEIPDLLPLFYGGNALSGNEASGEQRGQTLVAGWSSHTQRSLETTPKQPKAGTPNTQGF